MFPHGETVTVERRSAPDRWGDRSAGTEFEVAGVAFAPRASTEDNAQANRVITGLTMYAAHGTDIRPADVIRRSGDRRYQVVGEPGEWKSPYTGWKAGIEVALERVTG